MIIADTGFFFALGSQRDRYHKAALLALEAINEPLITTYPNVCRWRNTEPFENLLMNYL